jgi:AraC family transcriptional regulator of adaptative response / DNA-3-methyladenine glycosylase II
LAYRQPATLAHVIEHLAVRAVPGLEEVTDDGAYRRVLSLPHGTAVVALLPRTDHVQATLRLADLRDLSAAVQRCRRLLDLDADPVAVDERLRADRVLAPLVAATPGLRVPRSVDPFEAAVRTVVGQQVSLAGVRHAATALVARYGQPLEHPQGGVMTSFPRAAILADADLTAIGLTRQRAATVRGLATAVADGNLHLDVGVDRVEARHTLGRCFGIGPWSVEEIALRGLGDPDAFPSSDLVLLRMAKALGLPATAGTLRDHAAAWRPWRASAAQHLWRYGAAVRRRAA